LVGPVFAGVSAGAFGERWCFLLFTAVDGAASQSDFVVEVVCESAGQGGLAAAGDWSGEFCGDELFGWFCCGCADCKTAAAGAEGTRLTHGQGNSRQIPRMTARGIFSSMVINLPM